MLKQLRFRQKIINPSISGLTMEVKRLKLQEKMMIIEPVRRLDTGHSIPLGFMFDFTDTALPADKVAVYKNSGIHLYFCNWLMEKDAPDGLEDTTNHIFALIKKMIATHDGSNMVDDMVDEIIAWLSKRRKEKEDERQAEKQAEKEDEKGVDGDYVFIGEQPTSPREEVVHPIKVTTEEDIISRKYITNNECMMLLLDIINEYEEANGIKGYIHFTVKEITIGID